MRPATATPRGAVLHGQVWPGGFAAAYDDGVVVLDGTGRLAALGPGGSVDPPPGLPSFGGPAAWVGPGIVDAHVHLAFGALHDVVAGGVTAVRDLGAPPVLAAGWRTNGDAVPSHSPRVSVAGPIITA